jgi:hypothetical protein
VFPHSSTGDSQKRLSRFDSVSFVDLRTPTKLREEVASKGTGVLVHRHIWGTENTDDTDACPVRLGDRVQFANIANWAR